MAGNVSVVLLFRDSDSHTLSGNCSDNSFGPVVKGCRDNFDFTLLFQHTILSILPSCLFIALSLIRLVYLHRCRAAVKGRRLQLAKLSLVMCYAVVQLASLVLWTRQASLATPPAVAAAALSFASSIFAAAVSYVEHERSLRPSALLSVYFLLTAIFDAALTRTLWLIKANTPLAAVVTASLALKVTVCVSEAQEKSTWFESAEDKSKSPEHVSGVYSQSLLLWLNRLFRLGYRKTLALDDLYKLDDRMATEYLLDRLGNFNTLPKKMHLLFVLIRAFLPQFLTPILPRLFLAMFKLLQPVLLTRLLSYLQEPADEARPEIGYGLIGGYTIVYLGWAISAAFYWNRHFHFVTMARGALVAKIYQKATRVQKDNENNEAAVSLMSTDVESIVLGLKDFHELWANALEVCIGVWLLEMQVGLACLVPLVLAITVAGATSAISPLVGRRNATWMELISKRVAITATALTSMRPLKMAGLQQWTTKRIHGLRQDEVKASTRYRTMLTIITTIAFFQEWMSPVFTLAVFYGISRATHQTFDTPRLFTTVSLLTIMNQPLTVLLQTLPRYVGALRCLERIDVFLRSQEYDVKPTVTTPDVSVFEDKQLVNPKSTKTSTTVVEIELEDLGSRGGPSKGPSTLLSSAFELENASIGWSDDRWILRNLTCTIPEGKLTLLLGPVASGKSTFCKALLGEVQYISGSIKSKIPPGSTSYCDQNPFLANASIKDNVIGVLPFNEPLYQKVVQRSALIQDFSRLIKGDDTVVGSNGMNLSGGQRQRVAVARALYARCPVAIFDDVFSGLDRETEASIMDDLFSPEGFLTKQQTTVVLCTNTHRYARLADHILILGPQGRITRQGTFDQVKDYLQFLEDTEVDANRPAADNQIKGLSAVERLKNLSASEQEAEETTPYRSKTLDFRVYSFYFKAVGLLNSWVMVGLAVADAFFETFPTLWLKWWAEASDKDRNSYYLGIYGTLQAISILIVAIFCYHALITCIARSGLRIHKRLLNAVMGAPLSFFSSRDRGDILSRFSQDLQLIDTELPVSMLNLEASFFVACGQAALISVPSPYIALMYPVLIILFIAIQRYYLRTSKQLRIMDLDAKTPLYTHFLETSTGIVTLRALGWVPKHLDKSRNLINNSQKPFYLLMMIQQWLEVMLNFIIAVLAVAIVTIATQLRTSAALSGVSLVSLISFCIGVQQIIIRWISVETSLGAISRIIHLCESAPVEKITTTEAEPPESWPSQGAITINIDSASWATKNGSKTVLRDIHMTIKPGERIGLCGRSGSGKSSLVACLHRFVDIDAGNVFIDGLSIEAVPRVNIRSRINTIPQETLVLPGSIAENLDPEDVHARQDLKTALDKVHLWDVVVQAGGLNTPLTADVFSQGQLQLFSLARALLKKGNILVLDEATSNVDHETDDLMQKIIREHFKHHTILAVAHRLNTIMDFDRIAVMEDGSISEFDTPAALMERDSAFRRLIRAGSRH